MESTSGSERHTTVESGESPATTVLRTVAAVSGTPVVDLPPLGEVVDPDALNDIFQADRSDGQVLFGYHGYEVTVRADDTVVVSEARTED